MASHSAAAPAGPPVAPPSYTWAWRVLLGTSPRAEQVAALNVAAFLHPARTSVTLDYSMPQAWADGGERAEAERAAQYEAPPYCNRGDGACAEEAHEVSPAPWAAADEETCDPAQSDEPVPSPSPPPAAPEPQPQPGEELPPPPPSRDGGHESAAKKSQADKKMAKALAEPTAEPQVDCLTFPVWAWRPRGHLSSHGRRTA